MQHIAAKNQGFNTWVMSDEIYGRLAYDGNQVPSIASLPGMTGRAIINVHILYAFNTFYLVVVKKL